MFKRMPLEVFLAWRYLRTKRRDSFISVISLFSFLGITLGVATLIIVMSVMNGFRHELMGRILGVNGHLSVYYTAQSRTNSRVQETSFQTIADQLRTIPGVNHVFPMVDQQCMVMANGIARGAAVHGVEQEALVKRPLIAGKVGKGVLQDFARGNGVLMGYKLAAKLAVIPGDKVTLGIPQGVETALGVLPKFRKFRIVGVLDTGMNEFDNTLLYMPLEAAQKFFGTYPLISGFEIFLNNPDDIERVTRVIRSIVGPYRMKTLDWKKANATFFSVVEVERNVMFIILTLIVLVAAFNVISGLIMLVKEKTRDIGILRTLGMSRSSIRTVFVLTGSSIGIFGTIAGTFLGLVIAARLEHIRGWLESLTQTKLFPAEFYFLSQLPSRVEMGDVLSIVIVTLVLSFCAALYPATRASRTQPAEALRFE